MPAHIQVDNLRKFYRVHQKEPGLRGSIKAFVQREYRDVKAVDGISFSIEAGEIVGFLGANGAGKTTTLKLLSGLLHPTAGQVDVLGFAPYERKRAYLQQFTLVMGQKNQLLWDLPAAETFLINQAVYEIEPRDYQQRLGELDELLNLAPLLKKQVRKLSLGERMKCELAAALLHRPKVLFLDEPTIGLDVTMQVAIRDFIAQYNERYGASVILTSHYMADVTALTNRIIVIDQGQLLYDGDLRALVEKMAPYKLLTIVLREAVDDARLTEYGEIDARDGVRVTLRVPRGHATEVAARLLHDVKLDDVNIEEPPIEAIIGQIFTGRSAPTPAPTS